MKTLRLAIFGLLLVGCGGNDAEEAAAKAREEARKARREAAREKARADTAERAAREAKAEALQAALEAQQLRVAQAQANVDAAIRNVEEKTAERDAAREQVETSRRFVPTEMTAEQKLAAYEAGGITGVPSVEAAEIIRKAKLEGSAWRANYEIEAEGKGYAATQEFATKITQMPTAVRDAIVNNAKREHPGNWSRIGQEVTEQAEAWTTLDQWKRTTMPGLDRRTSGAAIDAAIARYPEDWKMALFVVNDEVKKLTK